MKPPSKGYRSNSTFERHASIERRSNTAELIFASSLTYKDARKAGENVFSR